MTASKAQLSLVVMAMVSCQPSSMALAAKLEHTHAELPVEMSLSMTDALDRTVAQYPSFVELEARNAEALAWNARGKSWLAAQPALSFRYQSDRWGDDRGLEEFESGIELPIWRWGERNAVRSLGAAMNTEVDLATIALRWEVAGLLRSIVWDIALADNDHELAEEALQTATELTTVVERRHALGDVALSDVLLARTSQLELQTALNDAQARLLDSERAYRSLTTLEQRPGLQDETQSDRHEIEADHPALAFINAELQRATARQTVVEKSTKQNPTFLIGPRRERSAFGQVFEESVGVSVRIPFGGNSHTNTVVAGSARETAAIRAARDRLLRTLDLQLHEAAHELDVARQNFAVATERASLAERQYTMGLSAYEKGELGLIDLLRLRTVSLSAMRQVSALSIEENRQIAFYNQAVGELP